MKSFLLMVATSVSEWIKGALQNSRPPLAHARNYLRAILALIFGSFALAAPSPSPIEPAVLASEWADLRQSLAAPAVRASFEEHRWLPIRKIPVVFQGTARVSHKRGLSLAYTSPSQSLVIVDDRGILTRKGHHAPRELSAEGPMAGVNLAFLHVLRTDFVALGRDFTLAASREADRWTLVCEPKDVALRRAVRQLVIEGDAQQVHKLTVQRGDRQRIEIRLGPAERLAAFTADELKQFFR